MTQLTAKKLDRLDLTILIAGLATFAAITLTTITQSSVWFDEAFGAYLIRFSFWDIVHYTAVDVHPPVYYWLLKLWSLALGTSELALRSMSVLFMAVAITFAYLLVRRWFGRKQAMVSLAFLVLSPMLIRYGQEMRMYGLVAAITMAATYVLTFAVESKKKGSWILYGLLVALGMWTHYFAAIVWLAHWAWRGWTLRHEKPFVKSFFSRNWLLAHIVAVVAFLAWVPVFLFQLATVQAFGFWIPPVTPATVPNFLTNVLYYKDQDTVSPWLTLLFLVLLIGIIVMAVKVYRSLNDTMRSRYMLLLSISIVPIVLLVVASMPPLRSSFIDRYLVSSVLGLSMVIGVTIATKTTMRGVYQKVAGGLMVIGMIIGIASVYELGNYNKNSRTNNETRQIIQAMAAKAAPDQPFIADSPWLFYEGVFYDTTDHPVLFIGPNTEYKYGSLEMLKPASSHKIENLAAYAHDHPVVWYFSRPQQAEVTSPDSHWKVLQKVEVKDSLSGQPAYKAVQYQTNGE